MCFEFSWLTVSKQWRSVLVHFLGQCPAQNPIELYCSTASAQPHSLIFLSLIYNKQVKKCYHRIILLNKEQKTLSLPYNLIILPTIKLQKQKHFKQKCVMSCISGYSGILLINNPFKGVLVILYSNHGNLPLLPLEPPAYSFYSVICTSLYNVRL